MKKISKYILTSIFAANIFFVSNAHALVIGFEDLGTATDTGSIPESYLNFTWSTNAHYIGKDYIPGTGYEYGTNLNVSLFNFGNGPINFTANENGTFTFNGAYITAAWINQTVVVEGLLEGGLVCSQEVDVVNTGKTWFDFCSSDPIDTVIFTPSNTEFVIDDITIEESTPIVVLIDIKPDDGEENSINLCSNGAVPVAVLGSGTFDVNDIDTTTLKLAGARVKVVGKKIKQLCSYEDVNSDGHADLICHFIMIDLASEDGTPTSVNLTGNLLDGSEILGSDTVNIVKDECN